MPLIAIILDVLAVGLYHWQSQLLTHSRFLLGFSGQVLVVLLCLGLTIAYHGPRKQQHDYTFKGYRYLTIRFAIILFSLLINGIVLFLYYLNLTGRNTMIFAG